MPGLKDRIGHEYGYTRAVSGAYQKAGYDVSILGSRSASEFVSEIDGFSPAFRDAADRPDRSVPFWVLPQRAWYFLRDLATALNFQQFGAADVIFDHTLTLPNFAGWMWAWIRHGKSLPKTILMFRYSLKGKVPSRFPFLRRRMFPLLYRTMFWVFERSSKPPTIVVDTEDLKDEYSHYTKLPIHVVPIPLDLPGFDQPTLEDSDKPNGFTDLLYLGGARLGKGFDLLPELANHIRLDQSLNVRLLIHTGEPSAHHEEPGIDAAVEQLRSLETDPRIVMIETHLDSENYHVLIENCDAVILPYRVEYYVGQSSNVLVEAISHGKPVIVPTGTWLASSATNEKFGTVFDSGDPQSFIQATLKTIGNISALAANAKKVSERWRTFHSAKNLVKHLIRI